MTPPFIVLEGPDGAGKTTVARSVADLLAGRGLRHIERRQISTGSAFAARLMEQLATMLWHSGDAPDLTDDFWAHLQASWFSAHGQHVLAPALEDGAVIVDGWYYKMWAKLTSQGWKETDLERLFARVRRPDLVILLRVSPREIWRRRSGALRPSEMGMHSGEYTELGEASFIDYQQRTLDILSKMAERSGWLIVDVMDDEDEESTAARVADLVAPILENCASPAAEKAVYTWPQITQALERRVLDQMRRSLSDRDGSGVIGEFERAFATFVGVEHALALSSGTAGLHAMCVAAGLRPGDEIIAPAYTFFATATPFAYEGVQVRFADADGFGNLAPEALPHLVTDRTRAVIVTHMWGTPCDMTAISAFCREHNLLLFEDCSHAHFASWRGQRVGTFGDMAIFSTNQKPITTGEGGVLITRDVRYRELALLHGQYNKRCFKEIPAERPHAAYALTGMGLKYRASTLGAAIGLDQLAKAADIESRRRGILAMFADGLGDHPVVSLVQVAPDEGSQGLYVMGLRFNEQAATCDMAEFVDRLTRDGADFDIPGSTSVIADEPLFHRTDRAMTWEKIPNIIPASFPGAQEFIGSFFKGPLWGYQGDDASVAHQYATLIRHADAAVR